MLSLSHEQRLLDRSWAGSGYELLDHQTDQETQSRDFNGLWRSEGGSLYVCDGPSLVCISVHSAEFRGWVGKVAVRDIHCSDGIWQGWQAFRNMRTGTLMDWRPITMCLSRNRITKYFSGDFSDCFLVYGRVEKYYRVDVH